MFAVLPKVTIKAPKSVKKLNDTVIVTVFENKKAVDFPASFNGHVTPAMKKDMVAAFDASGFTGKNATTCFIPAPSGLVKKGVKRLLVVGLGTVKSLSTLGLEKAGAAATKWLSAQKDISSAQIFMVEAANDITQDVLDRSFVVGVAMQSYGFTIHKSDKEARKQKSLKIELVTSGSTKSKKAVDHQLHVMGGTYVCRDLVNQPPNHLGPKQFVAYIRKIFKGTNVKITVMGEKKLKEMKANLLLSVGDASTEESHMVVMEYNGLKAKKGAKKSKPLALVGKGVCFDTGGNNIKSFQGMLGMKADMGGAAAVVAALKILADRGAKTHVVGCVGLVENMVAGNATRPSDVVTAMSGKTVEILNTDAEGRLVLADAMWHVQQKYKPSHMIDLATLTGAIISALGGEYAGLFANDNDFAANIADAGRVANEPAWHMPICKAYEDQMKSDVSDLKNLGSSALGAGSATAACFLKNFVQDGVKWAHLDIAGTSMIKGSWCHVTKGATGYGARILDNLIATHFEK